MAGRDLQVVSLTRQVKLFEKLELELDQIKLEVKLKLFGYVVNTAKSGKILMGFSGLIGKFA